ncbi:MAG: S8 family serine peptidase [Deinococcales bacterium]
MLLALALFLSACSDDLAQGPKEYVYVASLEIDTSATIAALEAKYGGEVILFKPQAGFAVLGFDKKEGELSTLAGTALNQDVFAAPEASAAGSAVWGGGSSAWGGGWSAWSGGWSAWSGGMTVPSLPAQNNAAWQQIKLYEAHQHAFNFGAGVKVAVIDSGIDLVHPMFQGRLAASYEWRDFIDNDNYPQETGTSSDKGFGHGTAVAGIIAQIAPKATILPLRVLDKDGKGDLDDVISAIDHAVTVGAKLINLSLGTYSEYWALWQVLNYAASQGVMIMASAGNEASQTMTHPAQMTWWTDNPIFAHLVSVGSLDSSNNVSSFSNYGSFAGAALGENIITAYPGMKLISATGTSFATPIYSGAFALALSDYQGSDPSNLFTYMANTGQWDDHYFGQAYGFLNADGLLQSAQGQAGFNYLAEGHMTTFLFWDWQSNASIVNPSYFYSGAKISGQGGFGQIVTGLRPNTTYTFGGYLKVDSGQRAVIGVRNYGGSTKEVASTSTAWVWKELSFTTGSTSTSAEVYVWKQSTSGNAYADEFSLFRR